MGAAWKAGMESLHGKANAALIAAEIESLGDAVTPQEILEKARDERTELHKCFEWDDSVAAEKWRLQQARTIVCHLVISDESADANKPIQPQIRYFHQTDAASGYKAVTKILQNQDEYQAMLTRAYAELRAFQAKYSNLAELQPIFELIA